MRWMYFHEAESLAGGSHKTTIAEAKLLYGQSTIPLTRSREDPSE